MTKDEALKLAAGQFRFYEREHRRKAADMPGVGFSDEAEYHARRDKAEINRRFAEMCEKALGQ